MSAPAFDPVPDLLIAVPVVIAACRAGAGLFRRLGQPPVIGEITLGILLGPSLLGWLSPSLQHWLFPPAVLPYIGALGNLGLLAFMFLVGLELDLSALRGHSRSAVAVSQASIALPLTLGSLLALGMYGTFAPEGVGRLPFVLFIAVSMSITAFPVLARILTDRGMYTTRLGSLAMACAAVDDVTAWCLLAVVAAVGASGSLQDAALTALWSVVFLAAMLWIVRPLLTKAAGRASRAVESTVLVVLFSGLCLSAFVTDRIGIHALFGAFLFGVVTPRGSRAVELSAARLRAFTVPVLLPLFFVSTGLKTDVALLTGDSTQWLWAAAVLAVAGLGKWGGSTAAARLAGETWRDAMSIGALMNCRGLTELVALNLGLQLGVIGPALFTILVLMALLTTAITSPALSWFRRVPTDAGAGAEPEALAVTAEASQNLPATSQPRPAETSPSGV
ncbi:cation:proton antiporter [Streptomyces diastatochromogenes]|uniref:Potassium transporter n=1 Tax=Streptomyces diastatochromogenes TaxID=42236 RepID=A0A233SRG8_STRDA|nr:cation:proton antiporter [Streptomyces diastatochromogenes]MCZ0987168.1 cation:proton antiporter [Streptomyces diastatochromogenes]OXY98231.1 potassium transporter [Streptomyces diastatochromogenes]